MYENDSFFTLSPVGQAGLLTLSIIFGALVVFACWFVTRRLSWFVSLPIAAIFFFAFVWLSPQVYYAYYLILFELEWGRVIQQPPTPLFLAKLLLFSERANLSFHSQGMLGWGLIMVSLIKFRTHSETTPTP